MTELKDVIIKALIADGTLKFYSRFVDDTLLVMKPENVSQVHKALNKFDNNLRFTVHMFQNETPHFLDLELSPDVITIFRKDTNTGLYVNFTSFVPWIYPTSWIRSLVTRASRISSTNKLPSEINIIKRFASRNDFPKLVVHSIINKTLNTPSITTDSNDTNETNNGVTIYFRVSYYGDRGCSLIKSCSRKIKSNCKKEQPINFRVLYEVTKIDFFCSIKDKTPTLNQSYVVYEFVCPRCSANYAEKTEGTLSERNVGHVWNDKGSVVNIHLNEFNGVQHMFNIAKLTPSVFSDSIVDEV